MYINTDTNQYPISENEIRSAHPHTSFSAPFSPPDGYAWVLPTPRPAHDPDTHGARELPPELIDGSWYERWETFELDPEVVANNLAAKALRVKKEIVRRTQERLDVFARERNYDDIKSACGYVCCSVPKFALEGAYCRDAQAQTWNTLYAMLDEVEAGTRPMPNGFDDVESELPALVWPTE